jgi:hypothetical protein
MFKKAFDTFLTQPDKRPSAVEWYNALEAKPKIVSFSVDKTFVLPYHKVQIQWNIKNAITVEIDNDIGDVSSQNTVDVSITEPTIFKLKATNPFGSIYSNPIEVATLNLKVPNSIFIPTPKFNLQTNFPAIKGINQIPSPNFPIFTTPSINVSTDLAKKINGNFQLTTGKKSILIQRLKHHYEWTKNILENSNYQLSFDDFVLHKIYGWSKQLQAFFSKKNKTK